MAFRGPSNPFIPGQTIQPFRDNLIPQTAVKLAPNTTYSIFAAQTLLRVHRDIPPVPVWGYGLGGGIASTPGPLLEARVGEPVRIRFKNRLPGSRKPNQSAPELPFSARIGTDQNELGSAGGSDQALAKIPVGWTVAHLHGGHTRADYDGWPDNMTETGGAQTVAYDNTYDNADLGLSKVGAFLWYHDHAMNGTRFHVYAGLAGGYLLRDPREDELDLPTEARHGEVVLVLQDRNLDVVDGRPKLLHKVTPDTSEFFGPLNIVNGLLWPRLELRPDQVFRLRLLNGCNARSYRLHLISLDGTGKVHLHHKRLQVIGTEAGLLWKSWQLTNADALTLAPGERLDVLLDLSGVSSDSQFFFVNSAESPFGGSPVPDLGALQGICDSGDAANLNPYPQVLRIDVTDQAWIWGKEPALAHCMAHTTLNTAFRRLAHEVPPTQDPALPRKFKIGGHDHKIILLAESEPPGHLFLHELVKDPNGKIDLQLPGDAAPDHYRVDNWMANDTTPSNERVSFYDRTALRPVLGEWQVWKFVNTTGDTHPIHIHQSQFQPLHAVSGLITGSYDPVTRATVNAQTKLSDPIRPATAQEGPPRTYEPTETQGWKDTIRVDPGNVVELAVRFDLPGRYVYHCHVLEHEDTEMMRPFVVTLLPMKDGEDMGHG